MLSIRCDFDLVHSLSCPPFSFIRHGKRRIFTFSIRFASEKASKSFSHRSYHGRWNWTIFSLSNKCPKIIANNNFSDGFYGVKLVYICRNKNDFHLDFCPLKQFHYIGIHCVFGMIRLFPFTEWHIELLRIGVCGAFVEKRKKYFEGMTKDTNDNIELASLNRMRNLRIYFIACHEARYRS